MEGQCVQYKGRKSRNCLLDIATGNGLDGRDFISGRGKIFLFSTKSSPAMGPTQSPLQWVPESISPGVKQTGREDDYSPPPSARSFLCLHGILLS
jgi:hypothetical protein